MSGPRGDRTTIAALVIAALTTSLLVAIGARHIVGYDSFWHVFIAQQERWPNFWREVADNAHPPLFYLLLRAAIALLGYSLLVYRLVSIAAIALSTVLVAWIVRRLTASPAVALAAAAAFALSFSAVDLGLEVRAYALNIVLMLGAFLLFVDWIAADAAGIPGWKRWLFMLTMSAALLTHYSAVFFLAATGSTMLLLASCHARWRRRLFDELRGHRLSAAAMFVVPAAVMGLSHAIHAGTWTGRIVHLPEFMFDPVAESASRFLVRTTPALVALFFPQTGFQPPMVAIASVIFVALLGLAASAALKGDVTAVPMALFTSMLALNVVAAVAGRYPYGGALRHESFLFPFLVIAVFVGLESARHAVPLRWASSRLWVGVAALVIGWNVAVWLSQFRLETSPIMTAEMQMFRSSVGTPDALLADQFNLIIIFAHYHDGTWRLHWDQPDGGVRQVWDVTRGSEHISVCRYGEWLAYPPKPSLYADLRRCLARSGAARVGLFRPAQPFVAAPPMIADLTATVVRLADRAGLSADRVVVRGDDLFAGFQIAMPDRRLDVLSATYGGNCSGRVGNVTPIVNAFCAGQGDCIFRIKVEELGDPAPGCAKDFVAVWTCGGGESRQATVAAEAGFGSTVRLSCSP